MTGDSSDVTRGLAHMRVSVAHLRNQLWDASRAMDRLRVTLAKDPNFKRADKDVKAALHGSYEVWRELGGLVDAFSPALSQDSWPPSSD